MPKNKFLSLNFILVFMVSCLVSIGLMAVYSATHIAVQSSAYYFSRQLTVAIIGLILMFTLAFIPFRYIQRSSYLFYGLSILLLIFVLIFGSRGFGAERWLTIGSLKLQPSEFCKLATIMAVAAYLSKSDVDINRFKHFLAVIGLIIVPFVLIARQPDLGTSLVFLAIILPLLYWSGLNLFYLFVIITPLFTLVLSFNFYAFLIWMIVVFIILILSRQKPIILISVFLLHIFVGLITPILWGQLKPYQQQRILTFANPEADPQGAGYQIIQSKVAIGSGGIWGKGFLEGTQTQLRFLPAQHTDFIFSVIGEEWGFSGVLVVMLLFALLLLYLIYLASLVRSKFASLVIVGIATVLFFHIVVNIGMTIGLAPVTGLPLPFISYGGSFLLSMFLMMGIIMNFSMNRYSHSV
ncbi:MAG: rod shape-determining protein RodA [Calditrichaceae bacterium]|nr:rod shape-determining protein RodA [Calditrichaceae bacterium]